MPTFDAQSATCEVFTFKEGLLSTVGHDLRLVVTRFVIEASEAPPRLEARFDATSLRVDCAQRGGADDRGALGDTDRRKIERAIVEDVLDARRHPEITFRAERIEAAGDGFLIEGLLTVKGRTRPLALRSRPDGPAAQPAAQIVEATLQQPDFGIKPYSALLGALRVRPEVRVRLRVPTGWMARPAA